MKILIVSATSFEVAPLIDWLDEYIVNPAPKTSLSINIEHFNTSSSKSILELFKTLDPLHKTGQDIVVNWFYEDDDEDIFEAGENYQAITGLPFVMVAI